MISDLTKLLKKSSCGALCALTAFSLVSCGGLEMRSASFETESPETSNQASVMMLVPAERKNELETVGEKNNSVNVRKRSPKKTVNLSISGAVKIDENIVADASKRAGEGQSYSFIKMFSGIYRHIADADLSMCFFKADDGAALPAEAVAVLEDVGYDVVDTTPYAGDTLATDYGINEINSMIDEKDDIFVADADGVTFAFLSYSNACDKDEFALNLEYADLVSDIIVASVHWDVGETEEQKKNAAVELAEAGIDVIIGDGDRLQNAEWIETKDGTRSFAVYSLGNILTSSDDDNALCSGILDLTVEVTEGSASVESALIEPTFVHYSADYNGYQTFMLGEYADEIAKTHMNPDTDPILIKNFVTDTISDEFLPENIKK